MHNRNVAPGLVSSTNGVTPETGPYGDDPFFSPDGTKLALYVSATNFPNNAMSVTDQFEIFLKNPLALTLAPVLISRVNATTQGTGYSFAIRFGSDRHRVGFMSSASNFPG